MRDLFQVVFELKKKEIELAKQHIEQQQMKFSVGKSLENLTYSKVSVRNAAACQALFMTSRNSRACWTLAAGTAL
jgi:hypothetical protein